MGQAHSCRKEILSLSLVKIMARLMKTGEKLTNATYMPAMAAQADLRPSLLKEGALRTIAEVVYARKDADLTKQGALRCFPWSIRRRRTWSTRAA